MTGGGDDDDDDIIMPSMLFYDQIPSLHSDCDLRAFCFAASTHNTHILTAHRH